MVLSVLWHNWSSSASKAAYQSQSTSKHPLECQAQIYCICPSLWILAWPFLFRAQVLTHELNNVQSMQSAQIALETTLCLLQSFPALAFHDQLGLSRDIEPKSQIDTSQGFSQQQAKNNLLQPSLHCPCKGLAIYCPCKDLPKPKSKLVSKLWQFLSSSVSQILRWVYPMNIDLKSYHNQRLMHSATYLAKSIVCCADYVGACRNVRKGGWCWHDIELFAVMTQAVTRFILTAFSGGADEALFI